MIASILLLAVSSSISSPYLGRFFTLPDWLGEKSVSSARTFGSVDATNATHRIDNDALKAVNALFEARCEREYWSLEGPTNDWDVTTYGPLCGGSDKHGFRFDLPTWTVGTAYLPGTNLSVQTRRLISEVYTNTVSLSQSLSPTVNTTPHGGFVYLVPVYLGDVLWCDRPGWRTNVLWSSTAFDSLAFDYVDEYDDSIGMRRIVPGVTPSWPEFYWRAFASINFCPRDWALSSMRWDNLTGWLYEPSIAYPDADEFHWLSGRSGQYGGFPGVPGHFAYDAWSAVNYGEPPFHTNYVETLERLFPPEGFVTNTTEWVIAKMFEGGDVHAETHDVATFVTADDLKESKAGYGELSPADMAYYEIMSAVPAEEFYDRAPYTVEFSLFGTPHVVTGMPSPLGDENAMAYGQMKIDSVTDVTGGVVRTSGGYSFLDIYFDLPEDVADDPERYNLRLEDGSSDFPAAFSMSFDMMYGLYPYGYNLTRTDGPTESSYNFWTACYDRPVTNSLCVVHGMYTNQTRRLFADRIAAVGQCLSMLDRTYLDVDLFFGFTASNVSVAGEIPYRPSDDDDDYTYITGENVRLETYYGQRVIVADIPTGGVPVSGLVAATNTPAYSAETNLVSTEDRVVKAVSPTGTEIGCTGLGAHYRVNSGGWPLPEGCPDNTAWMDEAEFSVFESNICMTVTEDTVITDLGLHADVAAGSPTFDVCGPYPWIVPLHGRGFLFGVNPAQLPFALSFDSAIYRRRYWYVATGEDAVTNGLDASIVYPGPGSDGVVDDARLHTLASLAAANGTTNYVYAEHDVDRPGEPIGSRMVWTTNDIERFDVEYASMDDSYHGSEGGMTGVLARIRRDVVSRINARFAESSGLVFDDPESVIPMDVDDPLFGRLTVTNATFSYGLSIPNFDSIPEKGFVMVGCRASPDGISELYYRHADGHLSTNQPPRDGTFVPYGYLTVTFRDYHVAYPEDGRVSIADDTHGTSVNAKMRHQSMVDWKWGALRREND